MGKIGRWIGLFLLTVPVHLVIALALTGVPKPPALATESVGRVAWGPLFTDAGEIWESRASQSLVAWMPDGSGVLVQGKRMLLDVRLHTLETAGEQPIFLPQIPRNAMVRTAPGRAYMVLGWDTDGDEQYRLYRWDLGDSEPVPLSTDSERTVLGAFEPDGDRIAYASTRRNGTDFDIYVMDVLDPGSGERVLEVEGMWGVAGWSPPGDKLLLIHALSNVESELYAFSFGSGALERLTPECEGPVNHDAPQWSRDGDALYYASDCGTDFAHLRRLDLDTGEEAILSDEIPWDVTSIQQAGDGETLLIAMNEDGRTRHYLTDAVGDSMHPLELFSTGRFTAQLHPEAPLLMVNHSDALGRVAGYTYDLRSEELTLWSGVESSTRDVREVRLVRYPTFDEVEGAPRLIPAFVYPGAGEGPRPVLIDIHGGPESQARRRTGGGHMERAGITVITPNVRGSTGYGRTFAALDDGYLREDAVRDIGALLDWIAEQPDMDESRVAVTGGSYGGYMVLASLVHYSARLRCGIDIVGISNFVTFLENTADYRRELRRAEYGDERIPEMRDFLESIAPLNNAEKITSPLMVVQGANDPRVPVTESRQLVERVRGGGLEVAYIEGANEGHGFRHPWNSLWAGLAQNQLAEECLAGS